MLWKDHPIMSKKSDILYSYDRNFKITLGIITLMANTIQIIFFLANIAGSIPGLINCNFSSLQHEK